MSRNEEFDQKLYQKHRCAIDLFSRLTLDWCSHLQITEEKIKEEKRERERERVILLRKWISVICHGKCKRTAYHGSRAAILHANGFFPRDESGDIGNCLVIIVGREIAVRCMNAHIRCIHNGWVRGNKKNHKGNTRPPLHLLIFR